MGNSLCPLQGALQDTLAPFRLGGLDVFPYEPIEFGDVTDVLHATEFEFEIANGQSVRHCDSALVDDLDSDAARSLAMGARAWPQPQ